MGSKIYPEVHENSRAFFNSSIPILLEPLAHGPGKWSLPREDCITKGSNAETSINVSGEEHVAYVMSTLGLYVQGDRCTHLMALGKIYDGGVYHTQCGLYR